jgi:hypothetical protein
VGWTVIPKVLHRIWVGKPMPEKYREFGRKWESLHPDWSFKVWGEEDLRWLDNQELFDNAEKYVPADAVGQFRSDVARYEILYRFGGVYADCDVEPQKSFNPLLDVEGFAGWEQDGVFVGNTVLGAVANNSVMRAMVKMVPESAKANAGKAATWLSGPRVLTRVYNDSRPSDFTLYPQSFFFPYSYSDLRKSDDPAFRKYPDAYSIHHWGHQRELRGRPLASKGDGSLSVAIMAHSKREQWVPDLEAQLPGVRTVWDRKNDRWDTGSRALLAYDQDAEWHMVVQDDSLLPPDFFEGVKKMLGFVPPYHPVGLYYGAVRPREQETRGMIARAQRENASFIVHNGPWWGVGIVLPTRQIRDVVRWGDEQSRIPNYDRRISRYYSSIDTPCYYPQPSLIQHRTGEENPSLVPGRSSTNRRAWQFVGPQSALEVDWSGPVIRSKM